MKIRQSLLTACALILATSSASAQWTGTRIGGNIRHADAEELMRITTSCIAKRGPAYARKFLETVPGTEAEFLLLRRNEGDLGLCMDNTQKAVGSVEMTFTPQPFRRALAREMVKFYLSQDFDPPTATAQDPFYLKSLQALHKGEKADAYSMVFMEFGDCVFLQNPHATVDYLRTEPGSEEEAEAIGALMPSLSPCLAAGQDLELSHEALRIALNEPVYHRLRRLDSES